MSNLPANIWFVRSNGGSGSYPIAREGWRVVWLFLAGMAASALAGIVLIGNGPTWLWIAVMAIGMATSGIWFIMLARAHTDYSITYNDYVKAKKNA